MLISDTYRQLNKDLHVTRPDYGTSGHKWAAQIEMMASNMGAKTLLDYGAGKQTLGKALSHMLIHAYDPAIEELSDRPSPVDLVVCTDVLEHIEPECLDDVLDDIQRLSIMGAFLVVAMRPAAKTLADGRNAHLIQEHTDWWLPKLLSRFDLKLFQDKGGEFAALLTTKQNKVSA